MIGDDDPFRTLGVEASASLDEIRDAYRRLLDEHRDARKRATIPRLMRAYELALELAQMRDEAAAMEGVSLEQGEVVGEGWSRTVGDPFRRPAGGWSPDPMVTRVRRHIEARAFDEAVAIVTSTRWQERVAEGADAFAHATMRLACATVWTAPEAYEALARVYIDRLEGLANEYCGSALPLMLTLDSDWAAWQRFRASETWLRDFLQLGMAGDHKLLKRTAREIEAMIKGDMRRLLALLDGMATLSPPLVAFTAHLARSIPGDLNVPSFPEQDLEDIDPTRLAAIFPRSRIEVLLPALLALAAAFPDESIALAMCAVVVLVFRDAYYNARYQLRVRRRVLELCTEHQLPPSLVTEWARRESWLSRARPYAPFLDDVVLDAAYALARLAHLIGPR